MLLYGSSKYEPRDEKLRYLTLPSSTDSVLLHLDLTKPAGVPTLVDLEGMKNAFQNAYDTSGIRVIQVLIHPSRSCWNESTYHIFADFTKWLYTESDLNLVDMNFETAYEFKESDYTDARLFMQSNPPIVASRRYTLPS